MPVEEAEEPSLKTQSPILCSSMWKMAGEQEEEEGQEGVWRKGRGQLVGSANRYGNIP